MQKLTRIYVGNYGYPSAWYDGITFDLTDPSTDEPTNTIINLENGGGKTSLLGFIFSCFDTSLDRFLQHIQDKKARFADYFSKDGLPGVILLEWSMPPRTANGSRYRLVIGQVVAHKQQADSDELDRAFFAFEGGKGLTLESVPVPKLNMAPANSMAEFSRWLHQAQKDQPDFFLTRIQSDWQHHLRDERLIDVDMLKMQVNFSAQEGGMDAGFLTFGSESEFLQKFFFLTVDTERAEAVRTAVATACDKLRKKPLFERRLSQLTQLQSTLQQFHEAALIYAGSLEEQKASVNLGGGMVLSLEARHQQREREGAAATSLAAEKVNAANVASAAAAKHAKEHVYWTAATHAWRLQDAKKNLTTAKAAKTSAERVLHLTKAASLQAEIATISKQIAELETTSAAVAEGLKPIQERVEIQGALLRSALFSEETGLRAQSKAADDTSRRLKNQASEVTAAIKQVDVTAQQKLKEVSRLQGEEEKYAKDRASLIRRELLQDDHESAADGASRLGTLNQALTEESRGLREQHLQMQQAQREMRVKVKTLQTEASRLKAERAQALVFVSEAENEKELISQLQLIRQAAQADVADPDSPALPAALDALIQSAERDIAALNVRIAESRASRQAIEETGVSGVNPDVSEVVSALKAAGVKSARAFNTYIAQALPDAERARALVASNPARYLGVAVADTEFEKAQSAAPRGLALSRPVMVSVTALAPEARTSSSFVVPAGDDGAFNIHAAKKLGESLDNRIETEQQRLSTTVEHHHAAIAAKQRLTQYLEKFDASKAAAARALAARLEGEYQATLERAQEAEKKEAEYEAHAQSRLEQAQQKEKQATEAHRMADELNRFYKEYEEGRGQRLARIEELQRALQELAEKKTGLETQIPQLEDNSRAAFESKVELDAKANGLGSERAALKYYDRKYPADEILSKERQALDTLRRIYADTATTFETEERDRLGIVHEKLNASRDAKQQKTDSFTRQFKGIVTSDLRLYADLHFETAIGEAESTVRASGEQVSVCDKALGTTEGFAKAFQDANKGVALVLPAEGEWDYQSLRQKAAESFDLEALSSKAAKTSEDEAKQATARAKQAQQDAKEASGAAGTLRKALTLPELIDSPPLALSTDLGSQVQDVLAQFAECRGLADAGRRKASVKFENVKKAAMSPALQEVEPDVAQQLLQNEFEAACLDSNRILAGLVDRISTTKSNLESLMSDFDACAEELYNLAGLGISLLHSAANNKKVPEGAPYVGGKAVLKMKANFNGISPEAKRQALRTYLDNIIETNVIPAKGTDLVAEAVLRLHGKSLGLQVLKMVMDEALQYVAVDRIHNSGGEGVVMAMFLYLVINQIRAESLAKIHKAGGGPLILDNPFAKATTPALWKAQRMLAKAMDVQLIFATAVADYNTVGEFQRFVRLRNIGKNTKTGRSHLEAVDFGLREEAPA